MKQVIEMSDCEERILLLERSLHFTFPQIGGGGGGNKNFDPEVLYKYELLIYTF